MIGQEKNTYPSVADIVYAPLGLQYAQCGNPHTLSEVALFIMVISIDRSLQDIEQKIKLASIILAILQKF